MKTPRKTLWLVRHARPLIEADRCYGRLDIPADAQATTEAAHVLHRALQPLSGQVEIWHSPLQRCEQLALDIGYFEASFTSKPDTRMLEMNFGHWEGLRWNDIGKSAVDVWAQNLALHAPGGGESLAQMLERVQLALQDARQSHQPHMVWICHAGVARCVQWLLQRGQRLPQSHEWNLPAPAYGQWLQVTLS